LEASLLRTYGFDLVAEWGEIGVRRLMVLVNGLPSDSPVWSEESWTRRDEFAALQLELTDVWSRLIFSALGGKPKGERLKIRRPFETGAAAAQAPDKPPEKRQHVVKSFEDGGMRDIARFFGRTGKAL